MNLLALDSSASFLSAALFCNNNIYYSEIEAHMKHSEVIMDSIDNLMKKALLKPQDLNGVLCTGGPGSFTGLRIGYSTAKGLALSLSIPFAPVPTLDCIAWQYKNDLVLPVIQAGKNAFFYAFFREGNRITKDKEADSAQIAKEIKFYNEKITVTGPGSLFLQDSLPGELKNIIAFNTEKKGYAKEVISIAQYRKIMDNDNTAYLYSGPDYIRLSDAEAAQAQRV